MLEREHYFPDNFDDFLLLYNLYKVSFKCCGHSKKYLFNIKIMLSFSRPCGKQQIHNDTGTFHMYSCCITLICVYKVYILRVVCSVSHNIYYTRLTCYIMVPIKSKVIALLIYLKESVHAAFFY